jgi:hypothetical protein
MSVFQSYYKHGISMPQDIETYEKIRQKEKDELQEISNRLAIYVKGVSVFNTCVNIYNFLIAKCDRFCFRTGLGTRAIRKPKLSHRLGCRFAQLDAVPGK